MTNAKTTKQTKNDFNSLAEKLGCKARIGGDARKIKFFMWTGMVTHDGYEVIVGIDANKFSKLIAKYPELQEY